MVILLLRIARLGGSWVLLVIRTMVVAAAVVLGQDQTGGGAHGRHDKLQAQGQSCEECDCTLSASPRC